MSRVLRFAPKSIAQVRRRTSKFTSVDWTVLPFPDCEDADFRSHRNGFRHAVKVVLRLPGPTHGAIFGCDRHCARQQSGGSADPDRG